MALYAEKLNVDTAELTRVLNLQRATYHQNPIPDYQTRINDLRTLQRFIQEHQDALATAISQDYGHRSVHETQLLEIFPVLEGIKFALKHLKSWMRPQTRHINRRIFTFAQNRVIPQPVGVVGVIVPWNFPVNLSFLPLCAIFAAGNRAMIKMSENSPHLADYLITHIPHYFASDKLQFFAEQGRTGINFSHLPFDHLLFTGSGKTGRAVMSAAAQNLCPVTLELGGKSPAILCEDFPLITAAERLLFAKYANAGQICTAVDYLFIPENQQDDFIEHAKKIMHQRYPHINSPDYTAIIDDRAFERLLHMLDEAREQGAEVIVLSEGPAWDRATRKIAPHLVINAPDDCQLMQREIFGPILPLIRYHSLDEVIGYINARPRPLAIYPFSYRQERIERLLTEVMSGGVTINDALLHVGQDDLPFGGIGESGMGHYHGKEGFETFSKLRPIFQQARFSSMRFLMPPYSKWINWVLRSLLR